MDDEKKKSADLTWPEGTGPPARDAPGWDGERRITSIMGGSTVYVPEHMNVEVSELAIMGGNAIKLDNRTPNPGGPTVRLRLFTIMGGTDVKRGPKRRLRDRLRRGR